MLKTPDGLNKEKYLMMCEQMGTEPDPDRFPIEMSDMPYVVQLAYSIYQALPEYYISLGMSGSIFGGKDKASLKSLLDIYEVKDARDKQLILDVILHLEKKAVLQAQAKAKAANKKGK